MGRQHRVSTLALATLGVLGTLSTLSTLSLAGCGKSIADQRADIRRQLLRADNLAQKRREEVEARRLTEPNGDLRPSNEQLAGITLPRGYQPKFVHDHEWTYDAELPFHKLEQYFLQRLSATIEHPAGMITRFTQARPVGQPNALPIELEVLPVPGRSDWSRIHIIQPGPPAEHTLSATEIAADIAARRRNSF
jgi:hypothetical protein